jgi:hypothetical protein
VNPAYHIDPEGEFVDFEILDDTGLTKPTVLTVPTDELGRIYTTARAAQLGADSRGDL